jgi:hypothetical protein
MCNKYIGVYIGGYVLLSFGMGCWLGFYVVSRMWLLPLIQMYDKDGVVRLYEYFLV